MISEKLAELYTKAEDKYFDVLDFFDSKGLPVYKYSDFFENRGVPSFVVTIAIIVAILVLITVGLTYTGPNVSSLTLSIKTSDGTSLNNVPVKITDSQGNVLFQGTKNDGDTVQLSRGLYNGEGVSIEATPTGYNAKSVSFNIGEDVPLLSFQAQGPGIEAKVVLIDKETKTVISGATVFVQGTGDTTYQLNEDTNGVYRNTGIPEGVTLLLKVTNAEGYNDYSQPITFADGTTATIELDPSTSGFVGVASLLISVNGEDGKAIDDVKVTVYDKTTSNVQFSDITVSGSVLGRVQSGIPLRIVAEKKGYLAYDSDKVGAGYTIRKKEDTYPITLTQGGQNLHVIVLDKQSGLAVDGATVQIFKQNLDFYGEGTTQVSGVDFNGLDPADTVYVTASREGYLPGREQIDVSSTDTVTVQLDRVTSANSSIMEMFTVDERGNPVNAVKIAIFEIKDGNVLPYGAADLETSLAGYVDTKVEAGKTYEITGQTDVMQGDANSEVKAGQAETKVFLFMKKKPQVLEMHFTDTYGKVITGNAMVSGLDGTVLFDDTLSNGSAFLDAQQREQVQVQITLTDGNVFNENVNVKGKDYVEVAVYSKDPATLSPTIEFVGIENEQGDTVQGITPGAFYWAKFNVAFPRVATKGGVHFRIGADNVTFAESEKTGLYDISFQGATTFQSSSYSPTPAPGNEVIDRANSVSQGEKSKWVEGSIDSPQGTYSVKVKIRAEDFSEGKAQLRYRAWSLVGSDYYRTPADSDLDTNAFTATKSALYAQTSEQDLTLYESLPDCGDNICVTTNLVDSQENFIPDAGFEALVGQVYALEVQLTAQQADYLQLNVSTDSNVEFLSTQTGQFDFVSQDAAATNLKKAAAAVSLAADGKEQIRFYFRAKKAGNIDIKVSATGKTSVQKDVLFKAVDEKTLLVDLSQSQVIAGRNFTVKVADQGLKGVDSALIKIIDKEGKIVKSILGDGSDGKGKGGNYSILNDLSIGLYTVEVDASGYASNTVPLLITTQTILTINDNSGAIVDTMETNIQQGQKTSANSVNLLNNSDFTIQNITVQTDSEASKDSSVIGQSVQTSDSGNFKIMAILAPALGANQRQPIQITVTYMGALDASADEVTTLTVSGLVEGKFLTKAAVQVHMYYNKKLDPSCLKVDPSNVVMNLLGTGGTTDTQTFEATNNCEQEVILKKRVRELTARSLIIVNADDPIDLQPGETKTITVTATNQVDRGNSRPQAFNYEIVYDSNALKKTIPITVNTVNPIFALSYPPQISLFLAQNRPSDKAVASQPLFVTNVSSFPVQNISFTRNTEYATGSNVKLDIVPTGMISLNPQQSATKLVYAEASSKVSEPVRATIVITGTMGQLNNNAGQLDNYNYYNNYYNGNANNGLYNSSYNNGVYNNGVYSNGIYSNGLYNNSYNNNGTLPLNNYQPSNGYNYGYNYYANAAQTLGQIDVIIYYSGYNCLTASLFSNVAEPSLWDFAFDNGGQMTKKVSITNKCAEPMRIIGALPASQVTQSTSTSNIFGFPTVASSILLSVPSITISPGDSVITNLSIMTAIPNISRNKYGVVIDAISGISQTRIQSKPFYINIKTGTQQQGDYVKAQPQKVQVCGTSPQQEDTVMIPKTALQTNPNCAEAYCDARSAAKYLVAKIRAIEEKAMSASYSRQTPEDAFPCSQTPTGVCTFEQLGLNPDPIKLYLQNDRLSADLLANELNSNSMEGVNTTPFAQSTSATGFRVLPMLADPATLIETAMAGYDKVVLLDPSIQGCGYYELSVTGAFRMGVDQIAATTPVLMISADPKNPKIATKECQESITNVSNFNPVDQGLTSLNENNTWLTTVDTDPQFKDLANLIAKSRYGTTDRVSTGDGAVLKITQGAVQGALATMCISGGEKKTITLTVDYQQNSTLNKNQTSRDQFMQSVKGLAVDALNGTFGNNCVTKSGELYTCVQLKSPPNLGSRMITLLDGGTIRMTKDSESCVDGTIFSTFKDTLNFDIEPNYDNANSRFDGIAKITISATNDDARGPKTKPASTSATTDTTGQVQDNTAPQTSSTTSQTNNTPAAPVVNDPRVTKEAQNTKKNPVTTSPADDSSANTKLSFAGPYAPPSGSSPPATAAPTASGAVTTPAPASPPLSGSPQDYYRVSYKPDTVEINNPIEINQVYSSTSKDYGYYRNIRVCIQTKRDEQATDPVTETGVPAYVAASGSQFYVLIKQLYETNVDKAGTRALVTAQTGTMHPDDLVKYICNTNWNGKDNYSSFFSINWQGKNPDAIQLGDYIQSMKRLGEIDNCTIYDGITGYSGTSTADSIQNQARVDGVLKYLRNCSAASAACNSLTGWSSLTLVGIALSTAMDCGVPAVTTYKNDIAANFSFAKSIYDTLGAIIKPVENVPILGSILKSMFVIGSDAGSQVGKTPTTPIVQTVIDGTAKAFLTRGSSRLFSGWPTGMRGGTLSGATDFVTAYNDPSLANSNFFTKLANAAENTTPAAIKQVADETSNQVAIGYTSVLSDIIFKSKNPSKTSTKAMSDFMDAFKKDLSKQIQTDMKTAADAAYQKNPLGIGRELGTQVYTTRDVPSYSEALINSVQKADDLFVNKLLEPTSPGSQELWLHRITGTDPRASLDQIINGLPSKLQGKMRTATGAMNADVLKDRLQTAITSSTKEVETGAFETITPEKGKSIKKPIYKLEITNRSGLAAEYDATVNKIQLPTSSLTGDETKAWKALISGSLNDSQKAALDRAIQKNGFSKVEGAITSWKGTSLGEQDIKKIIGDIIDTAFKGKASTEQISALAQALKAQMGEEGKAVLKDTTNGIKGNTLKTRVTGGLTTIGLQIGCSAISNYIGQQAYEDTVNAATVKMVQTSIAPINENYTLVKGNSYELHVFKDPYTSQWRVVINDVNSNNSASTKVRAGKGSYVDYTKVDPKQKPPEQRPLSQWLLKTDLTQAQRQLANTRNYPATDAQKKAQLEVLKRKDIQALVYAYTNTKDPNNKNLINGADEALVISVLLRDWGNKLDVTKLLNEEKTYKGVIHDDVTYLVNARNQGTEKDKDGKPIIPKAAMNTIFTQTSASSLFTIKAPTDFDPIYSTWDVIVNQLSPDLTPDTASAQYVAPPAGAVNPAPPVAATIPASPASTVPPAK